MAAYQRVLIGTDGSEPALVAVDVAASITARLHVPATVVAAWRHDMQVPGSGSESWAESVSGAAAEIVKTAGVEDVSTVQRQGSGSEVLIDVAGEHPDSLLVVGARGLGRTAARLSGSTSNNLSHHSPVDVLFVQKKPRHWATVGLATDGSETSVRAVRQGYAVATALGARAFLVTAAKNEEDGTRVLTEVEQQLGATDLEHEVLTGVAPSEALVNAGWKFDILVIGNRGMSGPARFLGSVANKVTHESEANLLLVNSTRS